MKKIHLYLFFLFFIVLSLVEGFRWILDMRFMVFVLYCVPILLFMVDRKKEYTIPSFFAGLSVLYLFFTYISVLNSKNRGVSYELFFRDVSLFFLAVFSYAHALEIKKYLPRILLIVSGVFVCSSLIMFLSPGGRAFIGSYRLNLLFNPSYPHKAIGDYLVLGLLISFYSFFVEKKWWGKYVVWFFLPFFILSFSRSAYIVGVIVLFVLLFIYRDHLKKIPLTLVASIILNIMFLAALFIVLVTKREGIFITYIQDIFQNTLFPRPLLFSRIPFWTAGIRGFLLAPFTGIGPGTYEYISYRFPNSIFLWSYTSFNLIIDLLAEQGILSTLSFLGIIVYIFFVAKKRNVFFLLFVAIVVSFMGFSTYLYLQMRVIFFILLGLLLPNTGSLFTLRKKQLLLGAGVSLIFIQAIFLHTVYVRANMRELAQTIYPYDRDNLRTLIGKEKWYLNHDEKINVYLKRYEDYFGADAQDLEYIGDVYLSLGGAENSGKALSYYEKSFVWGRYNEGNVLERTKKIYDLKKTLEGRVRADDYIKTILKEFAALLKEGKRFAYANQDKTKVYTILKRKYN